MKRLFMRIIGWSIALAFFSLFAAGCSGGGGSTPSASPTPQPTATATPTASTPSPTPSPVPSPTPTIAIALGTPQQIFTPGQLGLNSVPDEQTSVLQQSDGSYRVWFAGTISGTNGSAALLSTTDFSTFVPVVASGANAAPVFTPSAPAPCATNAPGSPNFDANLCRARHRVPGRERHEPVDDLPRRESHVQRRVFCRDAVLRHRRHRSLQRQRPTWTRQGAIVSGRDPQPTIAPAVSGYGASTPSSIVAGGFIYTFYGDFPVTSPGGSQIGVARATVASDGAPGSWQKWNNGSSSTPGIGGASTSVVQTAGTNCVTPRQPGISYNVYLKQYLLTFVCGAGWYFETSPDLSTEVWSVPTQFFVAPFDNNNLQTGNEYDWHYALVTPGQPSGATTDRRATSSGRAAVIRTRRSTCSGGKPSRSAAARPARRRFGAERFNCASAGSPTPWGPKYTASISPATSTMRPSRRFERLGSRTRCSASPARISPQPGFERSADGSVSSTTFARRRTSGTRSIGTSWSWSTRTRPSTHPSIKATSTIRGTRISRSPIVPPPRHSCSRRSFPRPAATRCSRACTSPTNRSRRGCASSSTRSKRFTTSRSTPHFCAIRRKCKPCAAS